jgi:hypothetical protein
MSTPDIVICSLLLGPEGPGEARRTRAVLSRSNLEIRIMVVNDEKAACRRFVVHGFFQLANWYFSLFRVNKGHTMDALASDADEGRGRLRKASVSC